MQIYFEQIMKYLFTQSWHIAILITVIAAVSFVLKNKSAHVRYLLWLIVLAKCLVPPLFAVPLAVLPPERAELLSLPMPTPSPTVIYYSESITPRPELIATPVSPVASQHRMQLSTYDVFTLIWMTGAGILLLIAIGKAIRTNHWLKGRRKALPSNVKNSIERAFKEFGLKKYPRVWLVEGIGQPFVWGLFRGSIYLPAKFASNGSGSFRRDLLGHELCHILRFDAAVNLLQVMAQAIFWFHPFVWWANKKIRAEREKCCDEMAIARLGAQAKDYSAAIVNILISEQETTLPVPSLAVAGPVKNIEERIKTMLRPGKKFYRRPSLVAAVIVLLVALLTVPTALVLTARAVEDATENKSESFKLLHQAAIDGDIEQVKSLISKGADVNEPDPNGLTPLHLAARNGHKTIVDLLIARGADVNAKPKGRVVNWRKGTTPLHEAAKHGHKDVAEVLITHGADVNAKTWPGFTPLYNAAANGHKELAEWLVIKGADVDAALYCAAEHGHSSAVKLLLAKGANVDVEDEEGFTALHVAAVLGHKDVIELLIDKGANVNAKDKDGVTPIYTATTSIGLDKKRMVDVVNLLQDKGAQIDTIHLAAFVGDLEKIKSFLKQGIDVNAKDRYGRTSLHLAVISGQKDVIELLIDKGAEVNAKTAEVKDSSLFNPPGLTPLHLAVVYPDYEVAKLLIENGADINAKTESPPFFTPLWSSFITIGLRMEMMFFDQDSDLDIFDDKEADAILFQFIGTYWQRLRNVGELLLERGANVNEKSIRGMTLLHLVASVGLTDAAELLIAHGAEVNTKDNKGQTPLHLTVAESLSELNIDREGTVKLLIAKGGDVNAKDNEGGTALWYAKDQGYTEIAELLKKHGAKEIAPRTVLRETAEEGDLEQVKSLIEKGADVNTRSDNWPPTPLIAATSNGHKKIVELLIKKGADIDARGIDNETALHRAVGKGYTDVTELLLANGADTEAKCKWGATPLLWAAYSGQTATAKLLIEHGADIEAKMPDGETTPLLRALSQGHRDTVEMLLDKGASVQIQKNGWDPMASAMWKDQKEMVTLLSDKRPEDVSDVHVAAYFGDIDKVARFLSDGGSINVGGPSGLTLLHCALCGNHKELAQYLIEKGADVNATDSPGWSPLHQACERGHKDIAKVLIANGAEVNAKTKKGKTPLSLAMKNGHKQVVELLLKHGAKGAGAAESLRQAVANRDVEKVKSLIPPLEGVKANRNDLAGRRFAFFWTYGAKEHQNVGLLLRDDGTIGEHPNPNESMWEIDEQGRVLIRHRDGRISTVLNRITVHDDKYELRGPFLLRDGIDHILREQ